MSALCAHPIAAIPFTRCGLSLSALAIGSMAPDFVYVLPFLPLSDQFGHTLPGIFLFCLPAGLLAFWIFHILLKYPLFALLPANHQQRLWSTVTQRPRHSTKDLATLLLVLWVGTVTHILWDSCTHWYGWTVQYMPLLRLTLLTTPQGSLKLYKVLQHGGTILGTLALLVWYLLWLKQATCVAVPSGFSLSPAKKIGIIAGIAGIAGGIGIMYGVYHVPMIVDIQSFSVFVVTAARTSLASFLIEILIFSLGWHIVKFHKSIQPYNVA